MGIRQFLRQEVVDFKDGLAGRPFRPNSIEEPSPSPSGVSANLRTGFETALDQPDDEGDAPPLVFLVEAFRCLLYGFILARPGVPLLPWGDARALVIALGAVVIASMLRFEKNVVRQLVLMAGMSAIVLLVIHTDVSPTSMLVIGAFVSAVTRVAYSHPQIYGIVAGVAGLAVATQVWDLTWFRSQELILSGRSWIPDRAGAESLLIAGFIFITMMMNIQSYELRRQKSRAEAAETARDAAVMGERARIARELHDVVSHHVTAMTLQAEAAATTGDEGALVAVASSGREALTELRRMLGVLRRPDAPNDSPGAMLEPQPDLSQLDGLAARATAGLAVSVERRGDVRPLPAGVELCAFRLVQESLTNSAKHSDATQAHVVLTYDADDLVVEIRDNGRSLATARVDGGGLGLIGMGERVALLEGELSTGPNPGGPGYQVVARLPVQS